MKENAQEKQINKKYTVTAISIVAGFIYAFVLHWFLSKVLLLPITNEVPIVIACLCLYVVSILLNFQGNKKNELNSTDWILYLAAVSLMPSIPMFHYHSLNTANFSFLDSILLSVLLAFASITIYLLISVKGDRRLSIISVVLVWGLFWTYPFIINLYPNKTLFWIIFAVLFGISFASATLFHLDKFTGRVLAGVICLLFLYNFGSAAIRSIQSLNRRMEMYQPKTSFAVDADLAHPDIYWFHMDGMMGFDMIETLFNDDQIGLISELADRGFLINEDAKLDVGWTTFAIPALTSPSVYDGYINDYIEKMPMLIDMERKEEIGDEKDYIFEVYPYLELFNSMIQSGYNASYIVFDLGRGIEKHSPDLLFENTFGTEYHVNFLQMLDNYTILTLLHRQIQNAINEKMELSSEVGDLYSQIFEYVNSESNFRFSIWDHYDWTLANYFEKSLKIESPKIVYLQNLIPHFPFKYDDNGIDQGTKTVYNMNMYMPQHRYAAKILIGMIDRVIEEKQDAIIIIQGDHGVHGANRIKELEHQGYSREDILAMNFSTISAVRIPEKYGTLTEPLDPLDITRYLVNHFVGKGNYDYLYYHEEE